MPAMYISNRYINTVYLTVLIYLDEPDSSRLTLRLQKYIPNITHVEQQTMIIQATMEQITTNELKFIVGSSAMKQRIYVPYNQLELYLWMEVY